MPDSARPSERRLQAVRDRLADGRLGDPRAQLVLVEWTDPGAPPDGRRYLAPLHVHHDEDEAWYVLEGALCLQVDDRAVEIPAGGAGIAPRGSRHTFWNPTAEPARYVLVMTRQIMDMIDAAHDLESKDDDSMAAVFAAHGSEYLGWPRGELV